MIQILMTKVLIIGGGHVADMRGQPGLETVLVDGHDAAVFVQRIKGMLEHPATLWVG